MVATILQTGIIEVVLGIVIAALGAARMFGANVPRIEYRIGTPDDDKGDRWPDHAGNFSQPHSSLPYPFDLIWRAAAWPIACYFIVLGHYSFAHNRAFFADLAFLLLLLFLFFAAIAFLCGAALERPDVASAALIGHVLAIAVLTVDIVMTGSFRMALFSFVAPLLSAATAFFIRK